MSKKRKSEGFGNSYRSNDVSSSSSSENEKEKNSRDFEKVEVQNDSIAHASSASEDQKSTTVQGIEKQREQNKTIKNLISAIIILVGIAVGSFFVDIVQFVSGSGYSEKALQGTEVFVAGDKTWVSFEDPAVEVNVLSTNDQEWEQCQNCDPTEVLVWLKRFVPTLVAKKVDISSPEGEEIVKKHGIRSIPAFVFAKDVENSEFFQGEASVLFEKSEDKFVLNAAGLGVPVGKYLEAPKVSDDDAMIGNKDAKVKVVVYSEFQCPYCKQFHDEIVGAVDEFGDDVLLVYKDMPLEFHPRAEISAIAARCAGDQEKYWEMAKVLYDKQAEWGTATGVTDFKNYARILGLDVTQFNECIDNKNHLEKIQKDNEEGESFGVTGVPATFINDQFVSGVVSGEELRSMISAEIEK